MVDENSVLVMWTGKMNSAGGIYGRNLDFEGYFLTEVTAMAGPFNSSSFNYNCVATVNNSQTIDFAYVNHQELRICGVTKEKKREGDEIIDNYY